MSKYSYELKLEVVQAYQNGKGGYKYLAKEYGISGTKQIREWVRNFENYGEEGLKKSEKNQKYSFDFKLSVVECYLTTETSYPELATAHNIKNPATICRWVQDFHEHGLDGLREKPKGRTAKMKNADNISKNPEKSTGKQNQDDYIKELEVKLAETKQELLYAEIENKYLKELRKLRLKREAERTSNPAKQQESSTTSEDPTN